MKRRFLYDHGVLVAGGGQRTVKTGELSVRAKIDASTLNIEERTVDVCFATDTPILMGYWERYYEILSFEGDHCDLSRLNAGAPMLDNHNRWGGASEQPGVVERAWGKDGKGYATLRFANDKSTQAGVPDGPGEKIFQRVKDKIVRSVSVGYVVSEYEEIDNAGTTTQGKAGENKIPTYRAIKWQPFEISFAPIPADTGAGVRDLQQRSGGEPTAYNVPIIFSNQNQTEEMKRKFLFNAGTSGEGGGGGEPVPVAPAAPAAPAQRNIDPAPAPAPVGPSQADAAATRTAELMDLGQIAGWSLAETRTHIDSGKTIAEIRTALIASRAAAAPIQHGNSAAATAGDDQRKAKRKAVEEALLHRAMPSLFQLTPEGRDFRGMDLMDLAREFVTDVAHGHIRGKSKREIAEAALNCGSGRSGMMSTSDLPNVMTNVVNKVLMAAYESQNSDWRKLGRQTSFKDFRQNTIVQLSEGQDMNLVREGGEYERMTISDGKETIQAFKYGRIIPITWETFVNDDLNALGRIPAAFSEMAARKQADLAFAPILNNQTMGDGVALFHATHGNLLSASAITATSMNAMRKAFRTQKGPAGKQALNLTPKYILVGPDKEMEALQLTSAAYMPTTQTAINVWQGSYTPIVEARITGNAWYGIVDPARIETMQYGFLEGEGELFTTQREGFDTDGLEIKARMVFGVKVIDWRGWAYNPGA